MKIRARSMHETKLFASGVLAFMIVAAASGQQSKRVDDTTLRNAGKSGEDWLSYGVIPQETRYSPLSQINAGNVSRLSLAWSYDLGSGGGNQEGTPLEWNGT